MQRKLTTFTWGYWGWGQATRALVAAFDAVERARGHRPPIFVDIRASRSVRATGFRDDAFGELLGPRRYHWMRGLGNEAIATGRGPMRLIAPADAEELLDLIVAAHGRRRRVVFFCSCESPWSAATCHRSMVAARLLAVARRRGLRLVVEEWPGGRVSRSPRPVVSLGVVRGTAKAIAGGARWATLVAAPRGESLGLATGSLVELKEGSRSLVASVCAPRLVSGRWKVEVFVAVAQGAPARVLVASVLKMRAQLALEPRPSR